MATYNTNIKTLGETTYNETYEIKNDVDVRDFNEPCNIFAQNVFNDIQFDLIPDACIGHKNLNNLFIFGRFLDFHKTFIDYCVKAKEIHTDLTNEKKLDSYRFVLDVINHFKDEIIMQGFIDAYLQKDKDLNNINKED